ncbi:MAG: hypothetical protein Q8O24_05495 [Gallionellaceae bacterium]|nr:hypothetical protein [Gallionellaceae bacterium]
MHPVLTIAALCLALLNFNPSKASASEQVRGHVTKSGKFVAPHLRSEPNKNKRDNFSSKGSGNPYTGKRGTKKPDPGGLK